MTTSSISCYFFAFFLMLSCYLTTAQVIPKPPFSPKFPTANLTANNKTLPFPLSFLDGTVVRLLIRSPNGTQLFCGFYCTGTCTSFFFGIFFFSFYHPEAIWMANRDNPVTQTATLNFTADGELVLREFDGTTKWSAGKSVTSVNLTDIGNLVLLDDNNTVVWQSFDHPTDCLLPGQKLFEGQKLKSSVSLTNLSEGMYSLRVTDKGWFAYVESNPPQVYYSRFVDDGTIVKGKSYVKLLNGSLIHSSELNDPYHHVNKSQEPLAQVPSQFRYMKLMPDGHLKVFDSLTVDFQVIADLLTNFKVGECGYPMVCGRNAICSAIQQCSCPETSSATNYFSAVNNQQPNEGCFETTPLTCNSTHDQHLITLNNVTYFTVNTSLADMERVNMETCKQACLNNCSCKAAFFHYNDSDSSGECYLTSELFTMISVDLDVFHGNHLAFIKVQDAPRLSTTLNPSQIPKKEKRTATVEGATIGTFMFVLIVIIGFIMFLAHKKKRNNELEEEYLDDITGMPTRFSYEELRTATENFSKKLGKGGFGSVFEGTLEDGSKIAVKCLEGVAHIKKSFLAEIESIGNIHHVNLVRLRGFCTWKSQRFLVYEFMCNGSLDKWIYRVDMGQVLEWECRKKIVLDIAKGLAYLHEECRKKIIHFDIKPQNILLDSNFNAKVADFGLSKLVDKNQIQVMTTIKGTPGYIAPEWWSSYITDKVDVYSFGIVLLEIIYGRKIFDRSLSEESCHLLFVFQKCWEEGELKIVDNFTDDMKAHSTEVVEMMKIASWCLQTDYTRRPSMSSVVKVLEGVMKVESNLDYNFTDPRLHKNNNHEKDFTPLLPSVLSGPR